MSTITKTTMQLFIETARAYWRAAAELAEVERCYDGAPYLQRQDHKDMLVLDRQYQELMDEWSDPASMEADERPVFECSDANAYAHNTKCEIITANRDEEGRCPVCAERRKIHDSWEHAR